MEWRFWRKRPAPAPAAPDPIDAAARAYAASLPDARDSVLETAIHDAPDDDATWMVYADWLLAQGHPRGELIAAALQAETNAGAAKAVLKLVDRYREVFVGPLQPFQLVDDWSGNEAFTWRRGFIHRARFSMGSDQPTRPQLTDAIATLLTHPSGRFLQELAIGLTGYDVGEPLDPVCAIVAQHGAPSLRRLHVGDFLYPDECEISWYTVGDLTALWPALPRLAALVVQGAEMKLGTPSLPQLTELTIRTGGLDRQTMLDLCGMQLPSLRSLEVWTGDPNYGCTTTFDDAAALWARAWPLAALGFRNSDFVDEVARALPRAPFAATLESLDLSMGTLSDDGARALAAHADAFPKLARVDVSESFLTAAGIGALRDAFDNVIALEQRTGERYVSVGE